MQSTCRHDDLLGGVQRVLEPLRIDLHSDGGIGRVKDDPFCHGQREQNEVRVCLLDRRLQESRLRGVTEVGIIVDGGERIRRADEPATLEAMDTVDADSGQTFLYPSSEGAGVIWKDDRQRTGRPEHTVIVQRGGVCDAATHVRHGKVLALFEVGVKVFVCIAIVANHIGPLSVGSYGADMI